MEQLITKCLLMLADHGPGFLFGALCLSLLVLERKRCAKDLGVERSRSSSLTDKLIDLSNASIKVDVEHTAALKALEKAIDRRGF
jgi:hypothetical protein